jgi:hypothetical protein
VAPPAAARRCRTARVEAAAPARWCVVGEDVPDAWWLVVVAQVRVRSRGLARVAAAGRATTSAAAGSHHLPSEFVMVAVTGGGRREGDFVLVAEADLEVEGARVEISQNLYGPVCFPGFGRIQLAIAISVWRLMDISVSESTAHGHFQPIS